MKTKLSVFELDDGSGQIAINPDHVVAMARGQNGCAIVHVSTGQYFVVDRSPQDVAARLGFVWDDGIDDSVAT